MRKPLALSNGIRLAGMPTQELTDEARRAQGEWARHVDAGRIGVGAGLSAEQRARLAHNERVLLGRVVTPELRAQR
ncbi:MAG: hypothetical protein V2I27_14780 [Erythrobacter sp.]|jgi:hypothetical protein|nr:hypothetical protein [Erythrobacter sp.]